MAGQALKTMMGSYKTILADAGQEAAPTDFTATASPAGSYDVYGMDGSGDETGANALEVLVYATATAANTSTIELWGSTKNGPPELITSIDYVFGTAEKATGILWAGTAAATSYHLADVKVKDSGNNRAVKVSFDLTGLRNIRAYVTTLGAGVTNVNVLARPW